MYIKISKKQRIGKILTKDTTLFVITPPNKLLTVFFYKNKLQTKVSKAERICMNFKETSVFWY